MIQQPITYRDGSKNTLSIFSPEAEASEVILIYPALGVRAPFYNKLGEQLAEAGFAAVSTDWRGHGASSERPKPGIDHGYETYILDMDETVDWVRERWPGKRVSLLGHSLGGQIGSMHQARFPDKIDRIILAASCSQDPSSWPWSFRWKLLVIRRLLPFIGNLLGYYPGDKIGFGGREFRTVMNDWGKTMYAGEYQPQDAAFDYEAAFPTRKPEILGIYFTEDAWMNEKAMRRLASKFHPDSNFQLHRVEGYDHFNWTRDPMKLVEILKQKK